MTKAITTYQQGAIESATGYDPIVELVLNSLTSEHSRRAYSRALTDFLAWWDEQGRPAMRRTLVQRFKHKLQDDGLAPSTINQRLSAIRKLAYEAADNGLADRSAAAAIGRVKGITSGGRRTGNWLTREQAQALLNTPNAETLRGKRDRAILAVLMGAGLRRSEAARLAMAHIQQREGRWVIIDLVGKRNKTRTVPIASWVKVALDAWTGSARISAGLIFRRLTRGGSVGDSMTSQAIYDVVLKYAGTLSAHDLRRTFAKLARKGGSSLEQIQLSLGHASVKTTEHYLGIEQDLTDAPADCLGLRLDV